MQRNIAMQLREAANRLPAETARLDAEVLLAHALGKPRSWLLAWPERELDDGALQHFQCLVDRRAAGEPVAYILGEQEFWSMPFTVTPATLIPRPDTEVLVEKVLENHSSGAALAVLDAGTGSGAIALALGKERPQWRMLASDASFPALQVAAGNAGRLGVPVCFLCADWLSALAPASLDILVSNPPYIAPGDIHLAALSHEPAGALVAPDKGLGDIASIVRQAATVLKPGGALYVEHGYDQGRAVQDMFEARGFLQVHTGTDYAGNERFTCGVRPR